VLGRVIPFQILFTYIFHCSFTKQRLCFFFFLSLSLYDISGVTVSIGVTSGSPLSAEMTRRISKIVLHSRYNAANFVSFFRQHFK
jgi:hypothetical protein